MKTIAFLFFLFLINFNLSAQPDSLPPIPANCIAADTSQIFDSDPYVLTPSGSFVYHEHCRDDRYLECFELNGQLFLVDLPFNSKLATIRGMHISMSQGRGDCFILFKYHKIINNNSDYFVRFEEWLEKNAPQRKFKIVF